ncbi:MAG: aminoacyl-tRNA hydrolase [Pseudomonadota bacterium]
MLIFVGLGNPGEKYAKHRHNVGFMAVDAIADAHGFSAPRAKFQGVAREGFIETVDGREKALILKPGTFMNDSGRSVREAATFYKTPLEQIFVFYDELDLAPGKIKVKTGGGHAGHNGIRSIDAHLGNGFVRIRIGIGHPGDRSKVTGHVLGNFSKTDGEWLGPLLDAMAAAAPKLCDDGAKFMSDVALRLAPPKRRPAPKEDISERRGAPAKAKTATSLDGSDETAKGPLAEALQKLLPRKE